MELVGVDRSYHPSNIILTAEGMAQYGRSRVDGTGKRDGCAGTNIGALLRGVTCGDGQGFLVGPGVTGTLHSADGISTEPIGVEDFSEGTIIISGPDGGALPASLGGSFRAVFPEGAAVQTSVCRTHARPVNRAVSMTRGSGR